MYRPESPIVLVRSDNNQKRQKFTAAHEIGHLLLGRVRDAGRIALNWEHEEQLCDEFAASLLLPPRKEVAQFLDERGGIQSPDVVLAMAHHFGVNLHPCIIALNRSWADQSRLLMVAELRGHPMRPGEVDYRLAASAGRPYQYIPRDQRLRSIGLESLADWISARPAGDGCGRCNSTQIPFWAPNGESRTGWVKGKTVWHAISLPNGVVIALIEVSGATILWSKPREREAARAYV